MLKKYEVDAVVNTIAKEIRKYNESKSPEIDKLYLKALIDDELYQQVNNLENKMKQMEKARDEAFTAWKLANDCANESTYRNDKAGWIEGKIHDRVKKESNLLIKLDYDAIQDEVVMNSGTSDLNELAKDILRKLLG